MKRYTIICLLLILTGLNVSGQKSYELSAPENTSKTYIARDYIRLLPGFSFNSTGGNFFSASINEHIVENAVYQTTSQLPNPGRSLNTSYAVGTIAGEAAVSPTGAAMYQIPITVMSGTGGMQPNISIAYNSQTGNGIAGYGWNLNALSAIVRTGKTIYHDGAAGAPQLNATDNLMMDGQRLMKASGTNLAANSTYKTEIESFVSITCKNFGAYPGFEVKNKEGWTLEYGSTWDSYIKPKDSNAAYAWLLKKASDANGNYMTYTYDNDASTGEFRLKQIDYTGNTAAGLNPYNKIEFFYETRTDKSVSYIVGKSIEQSVILKRIKCSAYSSTIREYRFNYYNDGYYSKLTEVEEFGQNGERYNSTVVDWGDQSQIFHAGTEQIINVSGKNTNTVIQYADFNNDGKTDLITYTNKASYSTSDVATLYLATKNNGQITFTQKTTIPLASGFKNLVITDMNGDGFLDVIRTCQSGSQYQHSLYTFSGETFALYRNFMSNGEKVWTGDFTGSGKHELILENEKIIRNIDNTNVGSANIDWGKVYHDFFPNNCYLTDFNGNGKTDILTLDGNGCKVYELNGSALSEITTFATSDVKNNDHILFGDFNEDGKIDLFISRINASYFILSM